MPAIQMIWPDKTGLAIPSNGVVTKDGFWFYYPIKVTEVMGTPRDIAWVRKDIWYFSEKGATFYKLSSTPDYKERVIVVSTKDANIVGGYTAFSVIPNVLSASFPLVVPTEYAELLYSAEDGYERWRATWDEIGYLGGRSLECYNYLGDALVRKIMAATDIMTKQEEKCYGN